MAGFVAYQSISNILLLPIEEVELYYPVEEFAVRLYNFEQGSTFDIQPIEMPDSDTGANRTIGWNFTSSLYLLQNNFNETILQHIEMIRKVRFRTIIYMGENFLSTSNPQRMANAHGQAILYLEYRATLNYKISYSEARPRLVISLSAIIPDILRAQAVPPVHVFPTYEQFDDI